MRRSSRALAVVLVAAITALLVSAAVAQPAADGTAAADPALRQLDVVKSGYPEIAHSARARVVSTRVTPEGTVYLVLKIRGANGQHVEALYEMVLEAGGWKINGVVARPDPGEEA